MKKYRLIFITSLIVFNWFFLSCNQNKSDGSKNDSKTATQVAVNFLFDEKMGSLTVDVGGKNIESGSLVDKGSILHFKAVPKENYVVDYWKVGGAVQHKEKMEWSTKVENHINVLLYFKIKPKIYRLSYEFNNAEGSLIVKKEIEGVQSNVESGAELEEGTKLIFEAVPAHSYYIAGWALNGEAVNSLNEKYEFEIKENATVKVYFSNIKYEDDEYFVDFKIDAPITIPTRVDDSKKGVVKTSFAIAKYELTYNIWYRVYMWAIDNGYTFANAGIAGSKGVDPTEAENNSANKSPIPAKLHEGDERLRQPVVKISFRDAIVWCNAYSEKSQLVPCYRYNGQVIKDATAKTDGMHFDTDFIDEEWLEGNGYRLPYMDEWEAAARFSSSTENVVEEGGAPLSATINGKVAYFTKGDSASGAKKNHKDIEECKRLAWFDQNSGEGYDDKGQTHIIATKAKNDLGLYDMAGNAYEFVNEKYKDDANDATKRVRRGGAWWMHNEALQIGSRLAGPVNAKNDYVGFRLVKTIGDAPKEIKVGKIVLGNVEYTEKGLLGGKKLSLLKSGAEEFVSSENTFNIKVMLESPKDAVVKMKIDGGAEEEISGVAGEFDKIATLTEGGQNFELALSKDGYIAKTYKFKAKKNASSIPNIPENVKIKKLYASTTSSKGSPKNSEANLVDYNLTFPASAAETDLNVWVRAEERDAKFYVKGSSDKKTADGSERLNVGELPKSGKTKKIIITVEYNGENFDYNLNITVQ